ncbi:hypothetical protein C7S18_12155 [Ahniella affigens]|uniref:Uncharacterized protein n=1 Tax=Ahniella affigens TaxID=2021234 RepID=A0A2P1PST9_9GAMM|nr:hypothetical protein [Ahniella affigens]AVP97904.1 hypothetical protein C7S18_12155 [Ahniella affigens]
MSFLGPLDVQPLITHLASAVPDLKLVDGAADLDSVLEGEAPRAMPAAYVVLGPERSKPNNGSTGAFYQKTDASFGVVVVSSNLRGATTGGAVQKTSTDIERLVVAALVAWSHPEALLPLEHRTRDVLKQAKGMLYVQHGFWTQYRKEKYG